MLLTGFAMFALVLASLGIYAVVSYGVTQRSREIGIRMALGASARDLQGRIIGQTMVLAATGIVIGAAVAWGLGRMITSMLFGVTSSDAATFGGIAAVLAGVAALAGYLPSRRAARVDPAITLRAG